jgi:8-oxo-dGTP diphosphatase
MLARIEGGLVTRQINVVGAVIIHEGLVLCAQRGPQGALAGLWEFPGGKVEATETTQDALKREIVEELRCVVDVGDEVTTTTHEYDFGVVNLTTFYCQLVDGEPQPTEHASIKWSTPAELDALEWAPADIPAVALVRAGLTR